ncbi:MAG: SMC-Scp complex subunit ScpB [Mycoplasmataceae bacterium]|jgi:segregation and condensation protein B|nr:SMC-Scp complex subunit ScpB [Mycoplasmataceae bacterium]
MFTNKTLIEALLFINGDEGVAISDIKKILNVETDEIKAVVTELQKKYIDDEESPYTIKFFGSKYFLLTKPEIKQLITEKTNTMNKRVNALSTALIENLAIIAYTPDCTSSKIAFIRNNDPTPQLKKLLSLGLITITGQGTGPGTPNLYAVTPKFHNLLGIKNNSQLPKVDFTKIIEENEINLFHDLEEEQ